MCNSWFNDLFFQKIKVGLEAKMLRLGMGYLVIVALVVFFPAKFVKSDLAKSFRDSTSLINGQAGVHMAFQHNQVALDNGMVQVNFSNPGGLVTGIHYNGIGNVLDHSLKEDDRGYWDIVWDKPNGPGISEKIKGTIFKVMKQDPTQIEISFSSRAPLSIDKRFIMRAGQPGIYCYGILDRPKGSRDMDIHQLRIVFKLWKERFNFMAISDDRQRSMPLPADRIDGHKLDYPEAVSTNGEVDDKYQYSSESRENRVHGWISETSRVGFWIITPSDEFRVAGPTKQDLTSHVGPTALSMFSSLHYTGEDTKMAFRKGEPWRKVFGPVFVYLNSVPLKQNSHALWGDAKTQMMKETRSWPYDFPNSEDFPSANERGIVMGRLQVCDPLVSGCRAAANAHVGLALEGPPGSWQTESKGYQFWTETDGQGRFMIQSVRSGDYGLYGWVPGVMGDFKNGAKITITPASKKNLGLLTFTPPRDGPTLWEIGFPDRTAMEFFVPDPNPRYVNHLYVKHQKYRQYGLWERYAEIYPLHDLVYTVGLSDYRKDWFYAQVTRKMMDGTYRGTTWQVVFDLRRVSRSGTYVLQIAIASATESELQVRVNDAFKNPPDFTTGRFGKDNAIARHGIHGLYSQYSVHIAGTLLKNGKNTIFLTQDRNQTQFQGIMYDYLRLEGPAQFRH